MPRRKTPYYPDYGPLLPNSGPDWRMQRAGYLLDLGQYGTVKRDGADIVRAARFLRAQRRDFSGRHDLEVLKKDPLLVEADAFRTRSPRAVLETHLRILAAQGPKTISVLLGLPEDVVRTYAAFFFDVGDRLDQRTFIFQRVVGLHPAVPATGEQLAMAAAHAHGPCAVEPWLDWMAHQHEVHDLSTALGRQRETIELRVTGEQLPGDGKSQMTLLKVLPTLADIARETFRTKSVSELIRENVSRAAGEMAWVASAKPRFQLEGVPRNTSRSRKSKCEAAENAEPQVETAKTKRQMPPSSRAIETDVDCREHPVLNSLHRTAG